MKGLVARRTAGYEVFPFFVGDGVYADDLLKVMNSPFGYGLSEDSAASVRAF